MQALADNHFEVLENYPASSPDLNVIESVWAHMREELNSTSPSRIESRQHFIKRLRAVVRKLNRLRRHMLLNMCKSMPERARHVLKLKGARTKF